jgi:hypothetical protein
MHPSRWWTLVFPSVLGEGFTSVATATQIILATLPLYLQNATWRSSTANTDVYQVKVESHRTKVILWLFYFHLIYMISFCIVMQSQYNLCSVWFYFHLIYMISFCIVMQSQYNLCSVWFYFQSRITQNKGYIVTALQYKNWSCISSESRITQSKGYIVTASWSVFVL